MPTVPVVFVVDDDPSVRSSLQFLTGSVGLQVHGCLRQGDHFSTLQWLLGFIAEALAQRAHKEG